MSLLLLLGHATLPALSGAQTVGGGRSTRRSPDTTRSVERLRASAHALQDDWLVSTSSGGETWAGINAWQRFAIVDALAQYTELSGDRSYLPQIERAVANRDGLDGNDDDLWAVIAALHVYRLDRSPKLLEFGRSKFGELTEKYWDNTCGGGMWWDHQRTYKNAITNELLLYAATTLYRATKDPIYSGWAHREWVWFRGSGMINQTYLVNDGLNAQCENNNGLPYTYNQGVILGGLNDLSKIEGDSSYLDTAVLIAQAAMGSLSVAGVLHEPTPVLNEDGQTFKGVFLYHLGDLVSSVREPGVRDAFMQFIRRNADSLWRQRRKDENKLNAYWDGSAILYGAAAQAAGLDLLNAAFRITALPRHGSLEAR